MIGEGAAARRPRDLSGVAERGTLASSITERPMVRELALLVGFFLGSHWLKVAATLPIERYTEPVILLAFLGELLIHWKVAIGAVVGAAALVHARSYLMRDWADMEDGRSIRWIVLASAVALCWPLITSEYNYFADRAHVFDRVLLFAVFVGLVRKPIFAVPLLVVAAPMVFEFAAPISNYPWAFSGMPMHVLTLFTVWFLLRPVSGFEKSGPFLFMLFCLIAGHYWIPGALKLKWGWLFDNELFYLLPATYSNGWLSNLDPQTVSTAAQALASVNLPMKIGAICLECGCLFILVARRASLLLFLTSFVAFHISVFSFTGIAMWQWIIVECVVLLCVLQHRIVADASFFTAGRRVSAILIVALAPFWLESAALSWYDSPVNYVTRFEAVDAQGHRHSLGPDFFEPFEKQFSFSAFSYSVPGELLLPITWGATNKETALALRAARSVDEIVEVERRLGRVHYDPERAALLRDFIFAYGSNYNRNPNRKRRFGFLAAPRGIVTIPRSDSLPESERIARIEAAQVTAWFDGETYREIRRRPLFSVDLTQGLESRLD